MAFAALQLSTVLLALAKLLTRTAGKHPAFAARLKEKNLTAQIKVLDGGQGRYFTFCDGKVTSKSGVAFGNLVWPTSAV